MAQPILHGLPHRYFGVSVNGDITTVSMGQTSIPPHHSNPLDGFSFSVRMKNIEKGPMEQGGLTHTFLFDDEGKKGKLNLMRGTRGGSISITHGNGSGYFFHINDTEAESILTSLTKIAMKGRAKDLNATRRSLGSLLPESLVAQTSSYLTGKEGTPKQQALQLREIGTRRHFGPGVGGKRRKTRRRR